MKPSNAEKREEATPRSAAAQQFRLYVSAASPASSRAVVNARRFFQHYLPDSRLVVLDIASHVAAARADQIVASPTLVRVFPPPTRRFIGDMSDTRVLRAALGLAAPDEG
jgi:circadian clock protein KaiB